MKKRTLIFAITILVIILLAIIIQMISNKSETKENKELEKVKVSEVTRSVFYAPQYVAINNGYFKKYGIDIDLTTGGGADTVMTAVLSNQVDIGFAGPEASIYVYNEGKEDYCQVFAQMTKKDGSFLISKTKTENFSWQDLKGKTVIPGRKGGVPYMTLEYVLKKNGINPQKDLNLDDSIKFDLMAGVFTSGDAEYVTLFEPTASLTEIQGKGYIVASVGKEAGEIPYTAYFAKKSYIEKNNKLVKNFTQAIYEGEKWVSEHTAEEIADVIIDFFPGTEKELIKTAVQSYKDIDAWNKTPELKEESFNRLQEVMTLAGELQNKAPYDKIVNCQWEQ